MSNARELAELGGSYGTGGFVGMKNRIINGDMQIAQRGVSGTTISSGYVSLDRWRASVSVSSTVTLSQQTFTPGQTDVPGDPEFFMRYDWLGTSPAATKNIMQRIENVKSLVGAVTLSFYAKTELGDDVTVEVRQNFGSGGSTEVTALSQSIDCTTGWQKLTITFDLPSLSGKTIGASSYIEVAWKAVDGSNSYLDLARVQLEKGSTATSFDYRPYGVEENLCQRYCIKYGGTNTYEYMTPYGMTYVAGSNYVASIFPVEMRAAPTVSFSTLRWTWQGASATVTGVAVELPTSKVCGLVVSTGGGETAYRSGVVTANNSTSAYLLFSSEL